MHVFLTDRTPSTDGQVVAGVRRRPRPIGVQAPSEPEGHREADAHPSERWRAAVVPSSRSDVPGETGTVVADAERPVGRPRVFTASARDARAAVIDKATGR